MSRFAFVVLGTQVDGQGKQILSSWPAGAFVDLAVASHFSNALNKAVADYRSGKGGILDVQALDPSYPGQGQTHYQVFETSLDKETALHKARELYDSAKGAGKDPLEALDQVTAAYGRETANLLLLDGLTTR